MSKGSKVKRDTKKKQIKKKDNLRKEEVLQQKKSARTIKYKEIVNGTVLKEALDKIFTGFYGADVTFDLADLKKEIKKYQEEFVEMRMLILKQFGTLKHEGLNEYDLEGDDLIKYRQELKKMEDKEIDIKAKIVKIPKRNIGLYSNKISVNDLVALEPFVVFTDNKSRPKNRKSERVKR